MYRISKNFASISIPSLEELSLKDTLSKKDYRVLIFLMARLNSENYRRIDKDQMSETLKISKSDIKQSLEHLINEDILYEGEDEHVKKGYKLRF
jgi:predicted transcriptional regulator